MIIFAKSSILDVGLSSECVSRFYYWNPLLYHVNVFMHWGKVVHLPFIFSNSRVLWGILKKRCPRTPDNGRNIPLHRHQMLASTLVKFAHFDCQWIIHNLLTTIVKCKNFCRCNNNLKFELYVLVKLWADLWHHFFNFEVLWTWNCTY